MRQLTVGRGERRVLLFGVLVEAGDFAVRMEGALRSLRYLMACSTPAVETSENDRLVAGILGHELVGGLLMSDFLSAFVRFVWYNEWGVGVDCEAWCEMGSMSRCGRKEKDLESKMVNASRWDKMRDARRRSSSEGTRREQKVHNRTKRLLRHHPLPEVEIRGSSSQTWDNDTRQINRDWEKIGLVPETWSNMGGKSIDKVAEGSLHGHSARSQDFLLPKHQRTWKTDTRQVNLLVRDQSIVESWYCISKKTANRTPEKDGRFGVWEFVVCGKPQISRMASKFDIEPQNPTP